MIYLFLQIGQAWNVLEMFFFVFAIENYLYRFYFQSQKYIFYGGGRFYWCYNWPLVVHKIQDIAYFMSTLHLTWFVTKYLTIQFSSKEFRVNGCLHIEFKRLINNSENSYGLENKDELKFKYKKECIWRKIWNLSSM